MNEPTSDLLQAAREFEAKIPGRALTDSELKDGLQIFRDWKQYAASSVSSEEPFASHEYIQWLFMDQGLEIDDLEFSEFIQCLRSAFSFEFAKEASRRTRDLPQTPYTAAMHYVLSADKTKSVRQLALEVGCAESSMRRAIAEIQKKAGRTRMEKNTAAPHDTVTGV